MSPTTTTFPTTLRWLCRYGHIVDGTTAPSALRHWEENGVFEVENELQGDTMPLPNVTLEHVAICDWWAGHGTLQHLDTWMRYHMQHSWSLPLASVESTPGLGPLLLWHAGLAATALSFASSIDVLAPLEPGAPTTPPEALLQLWVLLTSMQPMTPPLDDIFLVQARRLLTYYPSHCSWTLATTDTTPTSHCSFPGCALFVPRACTLSVPHLISLLQSPLSWPSERLDNDDDRIALKIGGLSILHDLLRQLTSSAAKCELLRVLYERLEVDVDAGCFSVVYNAWQEPRVVFGSASSSSSPRKSKRRRDSDASPLQILERDLHTFHGHVEHGKLAKAIENLYVRSAKVLASAESDPLLKKRALTLWTVHFHDVSLIRRAGILHVLGDLLATDAPAFAMNAASDAIYSSPHAAPAHSCLPPRLRPIEKLVAGATTTRSLHNAAWHVFAWLGRQLMLSTEASTEALSRPSSAKPSLHCTSPRKRLSLPPKLVSATLDESLAHTYTVALDELRRVVSQLAKWNALAHSMVLCLDDSQAILLADPHVVSSTNTVFLSVKERASFDWSTDGFAISLVLYSERDEKEVNAATPGASMLLLANGDVATHELALSLCPDGRIGLQLRIEGTSVDVAVVSARPLPWGHWTHLVGRFNPTSRRLEVFVDGMLDAQSECIEVAAKSVLSHHTFTVGGFVPPSGIPPPHPPHLLLDDVAFHLHVLSEESITIMASAGSLLFRIQQRQVLDNYCDQLLSLLVAPSRALPPVDDVVSLVVALFPVAPPRSHDKLFSLLTNLLPALSPASALRESVLSFLVQCFSAAWFGSAHETYGPPGLSAALSTRKDSVLLHLLNARQLAPDGVATWLLFEQPVKAKSLPLLRASRARLATGVVTLLAHLLQSPLWQPTLLASLEAWVKSAATWTGQRGSLADTANMATVVLAVNVVASTPGGHPLPATMPTLVAWSLTSSVSMAGHEAPTVATPVSSAAEMREDIQLAQHMHLRSALLRLCRLQAPQTAAADALLKPGLIGLLQLAIQPLAEAVATVFGSDFDIISKLDTVQALLEWILDDAETPTDGGLKRKLALEMLSTVLFERLPYVNPRDVAPWWLVNATQKLQVLGGDVEMEEYRVKGLQHFPTIKLTGVSITAGTGMWFYEVVLLTDGLMQIGWVDMAFEANAIQGQGVGDHTNSWAYDGFRRKNGTSARSNTATGGTSATSSALGVAFEGLHLTHALFPAMSLNVDQAVQLHFAKNQFLYCPTLENAKLQPVANAIVGGVCEHSPSKGRLSVETDHEAAIDRRRTDLIDGLIGLGFSPEWALRCARETSLDINESAAIAWIMEQMEADALAARPSHASQYRMHHLQQLDGFCGHIEKPALTVDRPQWEAVVTHTDVSSEHCNVLLVDETCEEVYADEGLVVHDAKLPSTSEKRSVGFILSLADHCRDDEILPLYVIAETVLCVWSAQDATHELLRSGSLACDERLAQHASLFLQYLQRRLVDDATANDNGGPYEVLLQQLCDASPAFFELLVRDLLCHVRRATAKDMASTPLAPGHAGASAGPNLEWARWLAAVVRRLATTHPARIDSLYAPGIWQELWSALGATPNATVRHAIVSVLATLLDELPSTTIEVLQLQLRVKHLIEWLGEKLRKTRQARVLASAYTQAIFQLTSCLYRYVNPKTTSLVAAPPPALPVLLVEHVTSSTVVLSCPVDGATALELAMETVHSNGHVGLSDFVELVDPVDLHRHLPYTLSHLQPETVYHVRSIVGETRSPSTVVETLPESVLELDAGAVGGNLELLHHNMTARNRVNKKWHAVRASVGFTSGVHAWDVRIDKCVSKNIFVGVCTSDACLDNYVGSDAYGWGFLANKAVWHNKTKLQTYGDIFKQGDVVSVVLDLDVGTLSFARNGESFGVAVENLHGTHPSVVAPAYYPAISMYNKDDQVTLLPSSSSDAPVRSSVAGASSTVLLALASHHKLLEMRSLSLASTAEAYDHWCKWIAREEAVVMLDDGTWLLVTTTPDACRPFGLFPGDVIFTSKGMCTILGVAKHELYYSIEAHAPTGSPDAIGRWKVHVCRDMVGRPSEFPVTRRHDAPYPLAPLRLSHDEFLEAQRPWTLALDEALLEHVYTTLHFQRYSSVFDVHANDLEPVPLALTPIQCAARLAWLRYLNLQAHVVLPCISLTDASMQCLRRRLFRQLPLRYARELLKKTATATTLPATAADELDDDPPDLIKCNIRAPRPCTSFWETSGVDTGTDDGDDETDSNVFCQLAAFFASAGTRELRRQYAPPPPPYADGTAPIVTRTFRVHWEAPDATLPLEPAAAYAHVLNEAARVVQSPTYPLLAPTRSSTLWFNLPFLRPTDCFALGQLAGIAWRSGVHLPWYFSPLLWKLLVREPVTLHDWAPVVDDPTDVALALDMPNWSTDDFASHAVAFENDIVTQATAPRYIAGLLESLRTPYKPYLEALQRGLMSVVPPTCLGLFSAATLAAHLCPAAKLLALQARTQYAGALRRTSTVVAFFWRILHALSLDEMHLLERFIVGPHWSPYGTLQLTLSPGDAHGGGYPRVERSASDACVLVLPLYPTQDMLHKKLILAMTQSPDQYDDDGNDDNDDDDEAT
ncbi:hypothetical protein SPRG_01315 [Saprolegnia parasitica CBS 223.65]|uniref:HECT-type E3 ubiquitin transferase n=1 Tax=Saprolegnia parasitica (strain CBS 223.65) TaxID=695850 RepID=A0A067D5R0_SAPPC|nr:hypothetical protein SPRG_01315 [Saprolegnia parasitica CBS 223.65]KDO34041.1 hypothetical protein SPRG_01315 [Saprolegnia parasitica CBS 223.65]|eukprot:XP_012194926.1 hypothetical protein SPRG_01315 [Saprolegnia parasitica CBS 223.65]